MVNFCCFSRGKKDIFLYFVCKEYRSGDNTCENKNIRVRNLKFTTSKTLVNFMKKMMFFSQNWYFSVQKALIYYTFNKSHHNSFILLVFSHVANFRYVANFTFLTLPDGSPSN